MRQHGLQTFEATDCLTRRRRIETTLHVVLWQVGLIGEMGFRRQGYLNRNFSYFVTWLQELYGADYEITHYIGSRYASVDPLVETHRLSALHEPAVQERITGLSTFYIPPRDVVPTHAQTATDLGLLEPGQQLVAPNSPLRDIDRYGSREMAAFREFERFRVPASYRWQEETAASNFLIELRFDVALQELFRRDPLLALNDSRFAGLSDRERAMLASRESGAIQVAAKGAHHRSTENERLIGGLLGSKAESGDVLRRIGSHKRAAARSELAAWTTERDYALDWSRLHGSIDFVYRNNLYPWTGIYADTEAEVVLTVVGNRANRGRSVVYFDNHRIRKYEFMDGALRWSSSEDVPFSGFLRVDVQASGQRRLVGRTWRGDQAPGEGAAFVATELDPGRQELASPMAEFQRRMSLADVAGDYAMRTTGRFAGDVVSFILAAGNLVVDGKPVDWFDFGAGALSWTGGSKGCFAGRISFLRDPIAGSVEAYGMSHAVDEPGELRCYGARLSGETVTYGGPPVPEWAERHLIHISKSNQARGGLMLWHKWEKFNFTSRVVTRHLAALI